MAHHREAPRISEPYPCSGGIHDCGQLISGCVWDTVNEIRAVDPDNAVDIVSQLFIGMFPVRGAMGGGETIGPEITLIFLQLDDDDGDVSNGTPHFEQIAAAFDAHNMQAPEILWLNITFPNGVPEEIDPDGGTSFQVNVANNVANQIPGSGTLHLDIGNGFQEIPMTVLDSNSYMATFPAMDCAQVVSYFVRVDADNGEDTTQPPSAPDRGTFIAVSAQSIEVIVEDDFETDQGWAVTGNATEGIWERGVPAGDGDRRDPLADADGSGSCYLSENRAGNSDVDGGSTILTSPILNASIEEGDAVLLTYYRWFHSGGAPTDTLVVEASNNNGQSWTTIEVNGPGGPNAVGGWIQQRLFLNEFLTPSNAMRVRFTAIDGGSPSIVEAGIDGVTLDAISCQNDILHGDVNLDGVVDLLDIAPFVDLLTGNGFQLEADINKDGSVDLLDIAPLVDLITS